MWSCLVAGATKCSCQSGAGGYSYACVLAHTQWVLPCWRASDGFACHHPLHRVPRYVVSVLHVPSLCAPGVAVAVALSMCLCLCSGVNAHVTHPCSPGGRVFVRASVTSVIVDDSGTARGVVMADGSKVMAKRGVVSNAGAQGVCVRVGSTQQGVTWCVYACSSPRRSQYVHEARSAASSSPRERQGHQEQRRGE